jgi:hypothetical protein
MIYPRITKSTAIGIGIAAVAAALCLAAIASDSARIEKTAAVDAGQYAEFIENEVFDVQDLAEGAEIQRRMFNRITPPGVSLFQPMFPLVVPFDADHFDDAFLDELLGEDKNSVAIYPLSLTLNPKTRETLIYNADGKLIAAIPSDKTSRSWPEDADPARVTLQLDLLPAEDVEPYLYAVSRIAEYAESRTAKTGKAAKRSLGAGEFGFSRIQNLTNGNVRLTVTNGADVVEIFAYTVWHTSSVAVATWTNDQQQVLTGTNTLWHPVSPSFFGIPSAWVCLTTNLVLTNGVGVYEAASLSTNARVRFFAAANRMDSDGDGLSDGEEILLHRTDPNHADSDGDGLSDHDEIMVYLTAPNHADTDGDGLPDGWEVQYGLNPLDADGDNGAEGDADLDGFSNFQEYQMGGNPNSQALSPEQLVYHFMNCRGGGSLRVEVDDAFICGGTNTGQQEVSDEYQVPPLQSSAYLINVMTKGVVEDHNQDYDIVSIIADPFFCTMREETEFFRGNSNNNECEMVTKTESKDIWFHHNGTVTLKYDTIDGLYHNNAYAEVIAASFVEMAPYSNQFFKVDLDVDTDRDGTIHDDLDEEGENEWTLARGALVPPRMRLSGTNSIQGLAKLKIQPPDAIQNEIPAKKLRIYLADAETRQYLWMVNEGGTNISFDSNGYHELQKWPNNGATFYAASSHSRKFDDGQPVQFKLELELLISDQVICSDSVQLTVAPLILPPECFPTEKMYSTRNLGISGITFLSQASQASRWAQDLVKFTKCQAVSNDNHPVFMVLESNFGGGAANLDNVLRYDEGIPGLAPWHVGGHGGSIMATPPLSNAPYGKIMLGSKRDDSRPFWVAQNVQQIVDINTDWLWVGHVDEIFMWISTNQVLYADPWVATDLLHTEIAAGRQAGKLWFGMDSSGTNASIAQVVIATNQAGYKLTSLPAPGLSASTNDATLVFSGNFFTVGDILRVGNEILSVISTNGPSVTVARAQADRPPAAHSPGSAIYAYSDVVRDNLPVGPAPDQSAVANISTASNQLRQALGAYPATFIPMPVLFGKASGSVTYVAYSANVVNCLVGIGDIIYYPYTGCSAFENDIQSKLQSVQRCNAWELFHCNAGELHCATAAIRSIQPHPPWWDLVNSWE